MVARDQFDSGGAYFPSRSDGQDPGAFLNGLDVGTPGRAAQRRAADRMWSTPGWSPKKATKRSPNSLRN